MYAIKRYDKTRPKASPIASPIASYTSQVIVYGAKIEINGIVYLFPYIYTSFYSTSFKDNVQICKVYIIYTTS